MDTRIKALLEQAITLQQQGNTSSAAMYARKVLKKHPQQIDALMIMLDIAKSNHDAVTVGKLVNTILEVEPNNSKALYELLLVLQAKELHFQVIEHIDNMLKVINNDLNLYMQKGLACLSAGKINDAELSLHFCLDNNFENTYLYLNLGHVYKAKGQSTKAAEFYQKFIVVNPDNCAVGYWSLADLKDQKFSEIDKLKMQTLLASNNYSAGNQSLMMFAIARACEQLKDFKQAFEYMNKANGIMATYRPFKAEPYANIIKSLIANGNQSAQLNLQDEVNVTPVFIIGMPRSGTTLVEQILAAHSQVRTTDELPFMERIALELEQAGGYAKSLATMAEPKIAALRSRYLNQVSDYFDKDNDNTKQENLVFIDKNPNNFLHVGLIKTLFPNAKIINVMRDPLDNAMSVFKQHFSNGHDYSYSLPGIAFYWQGYLSLMFHWQNLYKQEIYHLSYEALVAEPELKTHQLLEYCHLL